ncbi:dienelactone hydrolase family protein [Chitiniphilus purpureus]|uniref:Dienelactone hydrolase family protein n=1 Tax=Chitiniphilus purpureus TaxID=2981137 RepID=A0ABY6DQK9_9NEIS|nr:dienelactone hydrolase family protein [Chitiniphilus sp. CD1]UXY16660.1 dienelactone hydrolase family protein [Chitiniphilus sp. CD1]
MSDHNSFSTEDRRRFLLASLAAGFALTVRPVTASTIVTDSAGLSVGPVFIPSANGDIPAYQAHPANAGAPLPTVLVIQEIFGVHEHIQDVCRRLAKLGYLAIAPDLFARQGDPRQYNDIPTLQKELVAKVPDAQVLADLDAALQWAARNGGDPARVAITGFCWGGRITWLYAAHNPHLKAAVAWYGRLVGQPSTNMPRHPLDVAAELKAPVLGLYGGRDQGIGLDTVQAMQTALKRAEVANKIIVYEDAGHAFNADYRPSYHAAAARDGWMEMLGWFRRHGV